MIHLDPLPTLMIADDDPVVQELLKTCLSSTFEVVGIAPDSEVAVELARRSQPDAALVDVDMPKGGGMRAVRGILEVAPDTAIVVLSGDESDTLVRQLVVAGASAYRRKGIETHLLAQSLIDSIASRGHERRASAA